MELTNKLKLEMKDSNPQPQPTILRFLNKFEYTSCYWSVQFRGDKRKGRYKKYEIGDKTRHNSNSHKLNVHICAKISLWCNKTDWRTYKNLFGLAESIQEFSFLHSFVETWGYQDTELLTTAATTNLHCPSLHSRNNKLIGWQTSPTMLWGEVGRRRGDTENPHVTIASWAGKVDHCLKILDRL